MATILLAEDDQATNFMVNKILSKRNWKIISAFNGREAIDVLRTQHVDLVVTDIMMPYIDGVELLEFIKSSPDTKDVPVIGFSAGNKEQIMARLEDYQFDWFFEKPVNLDLLSAKAEELLKTFIGSE
jgi:CheY-like chemotaxis protein